MTGATTVLEAFLVSILIAALNEEENIRAAVQTVIRAAKDADDTALDIIIVNDGSTDRTGEICDQIAAETPFVRVVHHKTNMGQGAAIIDGLQLAKYDRLTMFPGDNELSYYTVRNLLMNRHKADYVLAMIINTEYRPAYRILLSAIFSHIYTTTFGLPIKYINAPALWPVEKLREMGLRARRYSLHGEINVKLLRQAITFVEIDGYMNPAVFKSSAVRLKNLIEVILAFLRLCIEIFVTQRSKYSFKAKRMLPPGVVDVPLPEATSPPGEPLRS
jgi:glycosyltransferase involved in cell wall biosynthesis